jgi:hypothetical protein
LRRHQHHRGLFVEHANALIFTLSNGREKMERDFLKKVNAILEKVNAKFQKVALQIFKVDAYL